VHAALFGVPEQVGGMGPGTDIVIVIDEGTAKEQVKKSWLSEPSSEKLDSMQEKVIRTVMDKVGNHPSRVNIQREASSAATITLLPKDKSCQCPRELCGKQRANTKGFFSAR
jgi:hypothetical protein